MRGATTSLIEPDRLAVISIHAPHAGRDSKAVKEAMETWISIHAPHAGRDETLGRNDHVHRHFNPRAPCGARRAKTKEIKVM